MRPSALDLTLWYHFEIGRSCLTIFPSFLHHRSKRSSQARRRLLILTSTLSTPLEETIVEVEEEVVDQEQIVEIAEIALHEKVEEMVIEVIVHQGETDLHEEEDAVLLDDSNIRLLPELMTSMTSHLWELLLERH